MPQKNIIVISVDGLRASALGAYGNAWSQTPALDALASQSRVIEWMYCDRPTLDGFFDAAWDRDANSLIERLNAASFQTSFTTDDAVAAERAEASGFGEVRHLEFTAHRLAEAAADTELAQVFAIAIDQLASWSGSPTHLSAEPPGRLLWIHARGYRGAWDAPIGFRASLLDEDDPSPPTFVTSPSQVFVRDHDELLLFRAAYAAQTMVLDACIAALTAAMGEYQLDDSTLLVLTSPRGYALGEHGAVGGDVAALYSELLHVPCLLRTPGFIGPGARYSPLSQIADIRTTILEAIGLESATAPSSRGINLLSRGHMPPTRSFVKAAAESGERAIRTPAWLLRQPPATRPVNESEASPTVELYVKPDDRWEANEVANRMPEVAARLLAVLDQDENRVADSWGPLDDDLVAHSP
jgi:arylsulfatase A-like enzyme